MPTFINRPCTLIQRRPSGEEDDYGNEIQDETAVETVCEIQQIRRSEDAQHAELSDTFWDVFFPAGTALRSGDAVLIEGEEYELIGDPWEARNPRTRLASHVEATARRVAGPEEEGGS